MTTDNKTLDDKVVTQKDIDNLRSIKDKELSVVSTKLSDAETKVSNLMKEVETLKGNPDSYAAKEKAISDKESSLAKKEYELELKRITHQYELDAKDLDGITSVSDAEIKARDIYIDRIKKGGVVSRPRVDRASGAAQGTGRMNADKALADGIAKMTGR